MKLFLEKHRSYLALIFYEFSRPDQNPGTGIHQAAGERCAVPQVPAVREIFHCEGELHPRYCDRIAEGETRNCQELAAQENFKKKAVDRPALGVYDRYYRRYAARKKVRQIKEDEFKKWRYEAMRLRDDCEAGNSPWRSTRSGWRIIFRTAKRRTQENKGPPAGINPRWRFPACANTINCKLRLPPNKEMHGATLVATAAYYAQTEQ